MVITDNSDTTDQSLAENFSEAAKYYQESFPERLANLFVATMDDPIYSSPDIALHLTRNALQVKAWLKDKAEDLRKNHWMGEAGQTNISNEPLDYIVIDADLEKPIFVSGKYPKKMNIMGLFDHEIAHLIVKEAGRGNSHLSECAADAYAVLRHIQRYGGATDIFECAPAYTARTVILTSPIHYTSGVIQKIANIHKEKTVDISSLSLKQTAELAEKIAIEYSLSKRTLRKIRYAYAPARNEFKEGVLTEVTIKAIAGVMNRHKDDHDIYRAGRLFLNRADAAELMAEMARKDPAFCETLAAMARHENDSGFLLDASKAMDAKPRPDKNSPWIYIKSIFS